jgi:hypothetical protein
MSNIRQRRRTEARRPLVRRKENAQHRVISTGDRSDVHSDLVGNHLVSAPSHRGRHLPDPELLKYPS